MWESQFQLAQQCACEGEFRAHHLSCFQGVWPPFLLQFPCCFSPSTKNWTCTCFPRKNKADQNPHWSGGPDLAAPHQAVPAGLLPQPRVREMPLQSTSMVWIPGSASLMPSVLRWQPAAGRSSPFVTVCSLGAAQSSHPSPRDPAAPRTASPDYLFNLDALPAAHPGQTETYTHTNIALGPVYMYNEYRRICWGNYE